jgi:hypothetical protein
MDIEIAFYNFCLTCNWLHCVFLHPPFQPKESPALQLMLSKYNPKAHCSKTFFVKISWRVLYYSIEDNLIHLIGQLILRVVTLYYILKPLAANYLTI